MLKECVVSRVKTKTKNVLLKNRDRNYIPEIIIVRDYIPAKDLELCYYVDVKTGWVEGMNSKSFALINSSLLVEYDEKEIELQKKQNKISFEGKIILNALKQDNLKSFIKSLLEKNRLNGHTFINSNNESYSLECLPDSKIFFNKIKDDIDVRTNHGLKIKKTGYLKGSARISTISRLVISKNELSNLQSENYQSMLNALSKDYINWNPKYKPNRNILDKMFTTMQILFDTVNKVMILRLNPKACKIKKIIDRRPTNIKKIKLKIIKDLK